MYNKLRLECGGGIGNLIEEIPSKEIRTYLGCKVFKKIKDMRMNRPSEDDVEQLCNRVGMSARKIMWEINRNTKSLRLDATAFNTQALRNVNVGQTEVNLQQYCDQWVSLCASIRKDNLQLMGREVNWNENYVVHRPESIVGRLFNELIDLVCNPQCGPHFVRNLLKSTQNFSIDSILSREILELKHRRDHANQEKEYRWWDVRKVQQEFKSSIMLTAASKKIRYIEAVGAFYHIENKIRIIQETIDFLQWLQHHLEVLRVDYIERYIRVIDKLIDTFEENSFYLDNNEIHCPIHIADISALRSHLDYSVEIDNNLVRDFTKMMVHKQELWLSHVEDDMIISEMISEFICHKFDAVINEAIMFYLEERQS